MLVSLRTYKHHASLIPYVQTARKNNQQQRRAEAPGNTRLATTTNYNEHEEVHMYLETRAGALRIRVPAGGSEKCSDGDVLEAFSRKSEKQAGRDHTRSVSTGLLKIRPPAAARGKSLRTLNLSYFSPLISLPTTVLFQALVTRPLRC